MPGVGEFEQGAFLRGETVRMPTRSPSAPVSRVFCAAGCPFIWNTLAPSPPIMPRSGLMLLPWQAVAVAWWDW